MTRTENSFISKPIFQLIFRLILTWLKSGVFSRPEVFSLRSLNYVLIILRRIMCNMCPITANIPGVKYSWHGIPHSTELLFLTVCPPRSVRQKKTMFVYRDSWDLTTLWRMSQICSLSSTFFFWLNTIFPWVNWSVFASLSTPAKQHLPGAMGSQFQLSLMLRSHSFIVVAPTWLPQCDLCSRFTYSAAATGNLPGFSLKMLFYLILISTCFCCVL